MENKSITFTPFRKAHTHFYDYIESFPGLPDAEPFEQQGQRIRNEIKRQMITGKEEDAKLYLKIRDCFTFDEKPYLQFCLKERTGLTIPQAARKLGLYKL